MVDAFPDSDLLCLWNDVPDRYPGRELRETWLARTALRRNKAAALPLIPATWRGRRPGGYDWALVSSHMFAHHVNFADQPESFRKYVYVHSPARYLWNPELDSRGAGVVPRLVSPAFRKLDRLRAQEATSIAANSEFVRDRVRLAWDRDAVVIYPPVSVAKIQCVDSWADQVAASERVQLDALPRPFVLGASRFIPYKRLDLVIAAGEAAGLPVVLAGAGPEEGRLRALAAKSTVPVHVVDDPSDALLYALYEAASVFVFPAVEDFGIMPVEAMATGTPVVVCATGGASETVLDGRTGAHIVEPADPRSLAEAVAVALTADPDACRARARLFDGERFSGAVKRWTADVQVLPYEIQ